MTSQKKPTTQQKHIFFCIFEILERFPTGSRLVPDGFPAVSRRVPDWCPTSARFARKHLQGSGSARKTSVPLSGRRQPEARNKGGL